ncbi:MAG: hydroxyacid dehydrogenase [Chloroflexi bacterium]|nr:hydroxyacid dehydrogenase [Chloroflexota bacterium]
MNVHISHVISDEWLAQIRAGLDPDIVITTGKTPPDPAQYEILVRGSPSREEIEASPNLRAVIIPWAGVPPETAELLRDYPHITLHNLHHNDAPTAEMAIALLMAATRFLIPIDRSFRRFDWTLRYEPLPAQILDGKTALILGFGAIGQRVGRVCEALGMNVLATRRHPQAALRYDLQAEVHPPEALSNLLPRANVLIITLPLTPETRGLIRAAELARLPDNAIFVNVGRGEIVDEAALYEALKSGKLAAAGLDVWWNYPETKEARQHTPPSAHPFHELDNVVMTPHLAGAWGTPDSEARRIAALVAMLNAATRGEPLPNRVDLDMGY